MSDTHFLILLAAAIVIALLQLIVLLRKPRIELPPELLAQLQRLEQQTQSTRMEVAKNDGALDGMANQLQGFTQATSHSLETVRQTVDEKLAQAVAESRTGRTELLAAFAAFEAQLAQRLTAPDAAQSRAQSGSPSPASALTSVNAVLVSVLPCHPEEDHVSTRLDTWRTFRGSCPRHSFGARSEVAQHCPAGVGGRSHGRVPRCCGVCIGERAVRSPEAHGEGQRSMPPGHLHTRINVEQADRLQQWSCAGHQRSLDLGGRDGVRHDQRHVLLGHHHVAGCRHRCR